MLAATVAFLPAPSARAAEPLSIRQLMVAQNDAKSRGQGGRGSRRDAAREAGNAAREAAARPRPPARDAKRKALEAEPTPRRRTARRHKGITIGLGGVDREYDSFDQFLDRDPALASMVLGIVFIVFLTPILIIALIIWYKMRKTRMQNETMLRLAEKGIVPPGEALQAIGTGRRPRRSAWPPHRTAGRAGSRAAQAGRVVRPAQGCAHGRRRPCPHVLFGCSTTARRTGSASCCCSSASATVVLWYFEDQQVTAPRAAAAGPPSGPGDMQN